VSLLVVGQLGFETVGRLPKVFKHSSKGYVDGLIMYKWFKKHSHEESVVMTILI
jgi:hypothetical protein